MTRFLLFIFEKLWNRWLFYQRGRMAFQPLFAQLHRMGLEGMNYGYGGDVEDSGELFVIRYVQRKLQGQHGGITVFDVGANIGEYTEACVTEMKDDLKAVYAFEPARETFERLQANLSDNRVHLRQIGLGEEAATLTLHRNPTYHGMASVYNRRLDHLGIAAGETESIEVQTLAEMCEQEGIERIDLLKMDVEGHELNVLKGAGSMLQEGSIRFIQFEFGGCNVDSRTYLQDFFYLLQDQYHLYRVVSDGLVPLSGYKEEMEIFRTINYLAERK